MTQDLPLITNLIHSQHSFQTKYGVGFGESSLTTQSLIPSVVVVVSSGDGDRGEGSNGDEWWY